MAHALRDQAGELLEQAGVSIGGDRPWDITVHHPAFYGRVLREGSLGLGESYMDGWWDSPRLDQFFDHILRARLDRGVGSSAGGRWLKLSAWLFNRQTRARAGEVGRRHYDAGNELFATMLDRHMVYTEGRWDKASTLEEAQEAKLSFVCEQLGLRPGMRVLDIGCGWASFAQFAAERYRARVSGVTVSREQLELGSERCAGLPVELRLQDYREIHDRYDRIVSLGMFEHVGYRNYRTYFEVARRCLAEDGWMYLSSIGSNHSVRSTDPWIERYIFPNSHLPSIQQIGEAIEDLFVPSKWLNWAEDYDRTLMAWYGNFEAQWPRWLTRYGERFCRMWTYYLLSCAGAFRAHELQAWQLLLRPL